MIKFSILHFFLGEIIWLDLDSTIEPMIRFCQEIFPSVTYACNNVPTYTCGCMGYVICSNQKVFIFVQIHILLLFKTTNHTYGVPYRGNFHWEN